MPHPQLERPYGISIALQSPMRLSKPLVLLLLSFFVSFGAFAFEPDKRLQIELGNPCAELLETRNLEGESKLPETLKVYIHNVENLSHSVGKQERISATHFRPSTSDRNRGMDQKPQWKKNELIRLLLQEDPEVGTFTEVEDIEAAKELFNSHPQLKNKYELFLIEGNDERGIDILTFVRKSLPLRVVYESYKTSTWMDPIEKKQNPLFSRDIPVLSLYVKGATKPSYVFMGNHAKSKRDRPGDQNSNLWRAAQYVGARMIYEKYRKQFGNDVQFLFQGDFNLNVQKDPALNPIREVLQSAFAFSPDPIYYDIITHTFHPRGQSEPEYNHMDDIRISTNMHGNVLQIYVVNMRDRNGRPLPLPLTYDERSEQPSDHWPVSAQFKAKWILE